MVSTVTEEEERGDLVKNVKEIGFEHVKLLVRHPVDLERLAEILDTICQRKGIE